MEDTERDIGYRILRLERRLAAYEKVHAEELDELKGLLSALKDDVLTSRGGEGAVVGEKSSRSE